LAGSGTERRRTAPGSTSASVTVMISESMYPTAAQRDSERTQANAMGASSTAISRVLTPAREAALASAPAATKGENERGVGTRCPLRQTVAHPLRERLAREHRLVHVPVLVKRGRDA
jgi:hypothetical protein